MEAEASIEVLWQKYTGGNKHVFKDIYLYYYPDLYAYGKSITPHSEMVDGAIQELFIRIWSKPFKDVQSIDNYLFISFRNELFKQLKINKKHLTESIDEFQSHAAHQKSIEDKVIEDETERNKIKQIQIALKSLPARRREAIYLKFFQNKSTLEISNIMNIREEMVRNYIYKGIKALRENQSNHLYMLYSTQILFSICMVGEYYDFLKLSII